MATSGVMQLFKGKVVAKNFLAGGLGGGSRLALPVTATANTDFTLSIPPGATIASMTVYTTTAYGAATDATIQIGSAAAGSQYVAATSIKAAGVVTLAAAATSAAAAALLAAPNASPNIFVRIVQTGAASATGAATLVIDYNQA